MKNKIKEYVQENRIVMDLAKNDFRAKYTNSLLGVVWAFLLPLVIILVLWFVFQVGFGSEPVDGVPFILWYIPAFLSWNFFTEAFSAGSGCISEYYYLVKNMQFRVETLPLVKIISASFVHFFFIGFIFVIYFIYGWKPRLCNLQVIYYYICLVVLLLGATRIMAALAVFSKDVLNIVVLVTQVGFWVTPLVYDPTGMPRMVQLVLKFNPMYYICMGYREAFSTNIYFWQHLLLTPYFWAFALIQFVLGNYIFKKLRPQFADMI